MPMIDEILARRHQAGDLGMQDVAAFGGHFEIADDFRKAEDAHGDDDEADAVREFGNVEGHAAGAGFEIRTDHRQQQAGEDHRDRLDERALGENHRENQAEYHQRKIFRGAEQQREAGERRAECGHQDRGDAAREERSDGRNRQRGTGTALTRHLMPVERRHHGRRLARNVHQDRRGRSAILRAVINAGEHDERADRRQAERDRQQHRERGHRADAGKHADERADHGADKTEKQIIGRCRDRQPQIEVRQKLMHVARSL
jgi:hypothetical protein